MRKKIIFFLHLILDEMYRDILTNINEFLSSFVLLSSLFVLSSICNSFSLLLFVLLFDSSFSLNSSLSSFSRFPFSLHSFFSRSFFFFFWLYYFLCWHFSLRSDENHRDGIRLNSLLLYWRHVYKTILLCHVDSVMD